VIDNHILTPLAFPALLSSTVMRRGFHAVKKNRFAAFCSEFLQRKNSFSVCGYSRNTQISMCHHVFFQKTFLSENFSFRKLFFQKTFPSENFPYGKHVEPSTHRSRKGEDAR
jgi:hypothetical protein